jgi:hypothetical protein
MHAPPKFSVCLFLYVNVQVGKQNQGEREDSIHFSLRCSNLHHIFNP